MSRAPRFVILLPIAMIAGYLSARFALPIVSASLGLVAGVVAVGVCIYLPVRLTEELIAKCHRTDSSKQE